MYVIILNIIALIAMIFARALISSKTFSRDMGMFFIFLGVENILHKMYSIKPLNLEWRALTVPRLSVHPKGRGLYL